jgi:hypothetical protein
MERKLIDYLPLFIQDYAEIKAIMDAEQVSVVKDWTDAENVMNDQFVVDATENGVKRWESILSITPKAIYTLDERKFNILAKLKCQLPYTIDTLKRALSALCGDDGYSINLDTDNYTLTVKLALSNEHNVEAVRELLDSMIPANLVTKVTLFNTHSILGSYTHEQLAQYTHKQLREDVIP